MRTFIGINFSEKLKNEIYLLQNILRKHARKGRWKYSGNIHLTLKFLDEISTSQKKAIDETLKNNLKDIKPFSLKLSDLGMFKGKGSIRVLWLDIKGDRNNLILLHEKIDTALSKIGIPPDSRKFKPHITIAQDVVFDKSFDEVKGLIGKIEFMPFSVDNIYLFKSEQIKNKRVYTKISEYGLQN